MAQADSHSNALQANQAKAACPDAGCPEAAMVFAAGLGARMRPITDGLPKPLVKIAGKTMLDHMLDRLCAAGVLRAVVNAHYFADQIEAALRGRTCPKIIVSDERAKLLDQAGGIKKALPALGSKPFFICNTDAVWLESGRSALHDLAAAWNPDKMDILLMLASRENSVGVDWPGDFFMSEQDEAGNEAGRLRRRGAEEIAPYVYAGVGIVKAEIFTDAPDEAIRLAPYFFEAAAQGRLFGAPLHGHWLHVGVPAAIAQAEQVFAREKLGEKIE